MEMMWGKDRRGLESALHIAQQLVVKRSFPRLLQILIISLIGNWSTLISHSVQAAAGGGGGGGGDCKWCRYRKWKRVSKMK